MHRDRLLWPKRDERSGANQIDLTERYTTRLDVPLYPSCILTGADDDLRSLPCGTQVLSNITFDVRGVIVLRVQLSRSYPWRWHWEQHPVRAFFFDRAKPTAIRLHLVRDELLQPA